MGIKIVKHWNEELIGYVQPFDAKRYNRFTTVHVTINECEYEITDKPAGMSQAKFFSYAIGEAIQLYWLDARKTDTRPLTIEWRVSGYDRSK